MSTRRGQRTLGGLSEHRRRGRIAQWTLAVLACCGLLACLPDVAAADSIVYISAGNVWLANADGTGQYQVTLDGTTASPYS